MELSIDIRTLAEFQAVLDGNAATLSPDTVDRVGGQILATGCREPLTGRRIHPHEFIHHASWREGLACDGLSSRVRGVMRCMEIAIAEQALASPRIYAAEGLTAFALRMRGLYPRFLGSEFTTSSERREWMYPIPCEDLQALSLPDASFDMVSTNEVLEHVPSIDSALAEMARVLRPGGWHFGTVPFFYFDEIGKVRAAFNDRGQLVHLLEPEYHGDPMNEGGVLVFEMPGWDLIDRARAAGFSDAFMRLMISQEHGILAEHIGGVLIFCCQK